MISRRRRRLAGFIAVVSLALQGCAPTHPSLTSTGNDVKTYFYGHCRNGEAIRKYNNAVNANRILSTDGGPIVNTETPSPEQIRVDKELAICSQDTDDAWLAQATHVTLLQDFQIDAPKCLAEQDREAQTLPNTNEAGELAYDQFMNCVELAALDRQTQFKNLAESTSFPDIREASLSGAAAESFQIKGDKDMVKSEHDIDHPSP